MGGSKAAKKMVAAAANACGGSRSHTTTITASVNLPQLHLISNVPSSNKVGTPYIPHFCTSKPVSYFTKIVTMTHCLYHHIECCLRVCSYCWCSETTIIGTVVHLCNSGPLEWLRRRRRLVRFPYHPRQRPSPQEPSWFGYRAPCSGFGYSRFFGSWPDPVQKNVKQMYWDGPT